MRKRWVSSLRPLGTGPVIWGLGGFLVSLLAVCVVDGARAEGTRSTPQDPRPNSQPQAQEMSPEEQAAVARADAEALYEKGEKDVAKGEKDLSKAGELLAKGDAKSLEKAEEKKQNGIKHFRKAAGKFREATELYPEFADAWNMLGYSLRQAGELEEAFEAYWACLRLDPEHVGAHEYLGEAWLQSGNLEQARGELAWLKKKGAKQADTLEQSIAKYLEMHPEAEKQSRTPGVDGAPVENTAQDGDE